MRIVIAGIIAGILMFVWSAVAHMLLPIGEMGMETAVQQEAALAAVGSSATAGDGIYMLPGMSPEQWANEAERNAFIEKHKASPYAFVVYRPAGNPALSDMKPALLKQFVSDLAGALLLAWVLASAATAFGRRVLVAAGLGLFAWLAVNVPYWNWYLFPTDFTIGALVEQVVGWTIAGAGAAWWLGRGKS